MNKHFTYQIIIMRLVLLVGTVLLPSVTWAADDTLAPSNFPPANVQFDYSFVLSPLGLGGYTAGPNILSLGHNDPITITYFILNIILSLLGTGFLVLLLYAGWLWLTARGNDEQITKAKQIIFQAVIGFIIVFMALGAAQLIFNLADTYGLL